MEPAKGSVVTRRFTGERASGCNEYMEHTEFLRAGKLMTLYDAAMVTHTYQVSVETHRPCNQSKL